MHQHLKEAQLAIFLTAQCIWPDFRSAEEVDRRSFQVVYRQNDRSWGV